MQMATSTKSDHIVRMQLAESSPQTVLRGVDFWLDHKSFVLVLLLGATAIIWLWPYTYRFEGGWVVFTAAAHILALCGGIITARSLATTDVDSAIAAEVESRGSNYLRDLKSGNRSIADVDKLEEDVLPNNNTEPPLAMIRMFQHLFKAIRDRRFDSGASISQTYREEPLEDIFRLQTLQKIALWIGILGTFVGLLLAMQAGSLSNITSNDEFINLIKEMFEKLSVSFSASLAGLEAAVILGFFVLLLRRGQVRYFQKMDAAVTTVLQLARSAINKDEYLGSFQQLSRDLVSVKDTVYNEANQVGKLRDAVGAQTAEINEGMKRLTGASSQFDGFLKNLAANQQQFINEVKAVYDVLSPKNLGTTLEASVTQAGGEISKVVNLQVARVASEIAKFNACLDRLGAALELQRRDTNDGAKRIEGQIKTEGAERAGQIGALRNRFDDSMTRVESAQTRLFNTSQEISRKLSSTRQGPGRVDGYGGRGYSSGRPRRRGLWEWFSNLKW
jgi:biopolymer transport protein ExbB/TolQ